MNPDTGEIVHGGIEAFEKYERKNRVQTVLIPEKELSAISNLSLHQRKLWAHANRPSLSEVVESGKELTETQTAALLKQERKRQMRLTLKK